MTTYKKQGYVKQLAKGGSNSAFIQHEREKQARKAGGGLIGGMSRHNKDIQDLLKEGRDKPKRSLPGARRS